LDWRIIKAPVRAGHAQQWRLEYFGEGEAPAVVEDDETTAERDFGPGDNDEDV
jgi:hypothetical protein